MSATVKDIVAHFWSRVRKTEGCWEWTGAKHERGYGKLRYKGRDIRTHRFAFFITHGVWPKTARHTCDNPSCVRPDHVVDGSQHDNIHDAIDRGRHVAPPKGRRRKVNRVAVAELRAAGLKIADIASRLGVSESCIYSNLSHVRSKEASS